MRFSVSENTDTAIWTECESRPAIMRYDPDL